MSPAVPRWSPIVLAALLSAAPLALASPAEGDLTFGDVPVLDGVLSASGGGEARLGPSTPASFQGAAEVLTIARTWSETWVLGNPVGGPVTTETGPAEYETVEIGAATFRLDAPRAAYESLVYTAEGGRIEMPAAPVAGLALAAYRDPALVVDDEGLAEPQVREDDRIFTYAAPGDRFPIAARAFLAQGAFHVYIWDADVIVTDAAGTEQRFSSGERRVVESPSSWRDIHEYLILTVSGGALSVVAEDAVAWFSEPRLVLDGTVTSSEASGSVNYEGKDHTLAGVPVTIEGLLELAPAPQGSPRAEPKADVHLGSSTPSGGRYPALSTAFGGDVRALALGGGLFLPSTREVSLVAAFSVAALVAALLLATPKGKWAVFAVVAPLYAKTARDRLLDNHSRERIFHAIRNNPGINLSQIHRLADLGWGVTVYHLKMMEKGGLIFAESSARDKCFFENDPRYRLLRAAIAALANKVQVQRVASVVVHEPGLHQRAVIERTGLSQRAVSYYLGRLSRSGLVSTRREKNFVRYEATPQLADALGVVTGMESPVPVAAAEPAVVA